MYTSLFHSKPVPICTYLSLTGSWYKYAQISISQEAKTNTYKSLPHRKLVQVCSIKKPLPFRKLVRICTKLSLTGTGTNCTNLFSHRRLVQICTKLYLTGSRYPYVKIFLPPAAGTNMYKSLPHRKPVPLCTNLPSQGAGTSMYKSLSHKKLLQICTSLFLTVSWYKLYVQYKSLFHREMGQICTNLFLTGRR